MRFASAAGLGCLISVMAAISVPAGAQHPAISASKPLPDKPRPKTCPQVYQPVCAKKEGSPKSYSSECVARMDDATDIKPGHCSPGQ